MRLLVASRNEKKLQELQRVLEAANVSGIELVSLRDVADYPETPETGATFTDNAAIKATDGAVHTGLPTIADDSGLAVTALNGMPGVLSARWCGEHGNDPENNRLLLAQMSDVPDDRRGASFVSACVLALPEDMQQASGLNSEIAVEGAWHGTILREEKGDNGFGYDPLFEPAETPGRSSAELSPEEKDRLSHRGKALTKLVPALRALGNIRTIGDH